MIYQGIIHYALLNIPKISWEGLKGRQPSYTFLARYYNLQTEFLLCVFVPITVGNCFEDILAAIRRTSLYLSSPPAYHRKYVESHESKDSQEFICYLDCRTQSIKYLEKLYSNLSS